MCSKISLSLLDLISTKYSSIRITSSQHILAYKKSFFFICEINHSNSLLNPIEVCTWRSKVDKPLIRAQNNIYVLEGHIHTPPYMHMDDTYFCVLSVFS